MRLYDHNLNRLTRNIAWMMALATCATVPFHGLTENHDAPAIVAAIFTHIAFVCVCINRKQCMAPFVLSLAVLIFHGLLF